MARCILDFGRPLFSVVNRLYSHCGHFGIKVLLGWLSTELWVLCLSFWWVTSNVYSKKNDHFGPFYNSSSFWTILYTFCTGTFSKMTGNFKILAKVFLPALLTLTCPWVWWGRYNKTISRRRKEGRVEKKRAACPPGPGLKSGTCARARRGSPTARHRGGLDKQAFPCL